MTKLCTIPDPILSITCGVCKHHSMLEVATTLMLVVGGNATAHDIRQRAGCHPILIYFNMFNETLV
jgi:hypothetical protein